MSRFFNRYFKGSSVPYSYLPSFLILHEITAIVPLPVFYYSFRALDWNPTLDSEWLDRGILYAKKRFKTQQDEVENDENADISARMTSIESSDTTKMVLHLASAYALTKMLLPARLALSALMTPWFARRVIEPNWTRFSPLLRRKDNVRP